MAVAAQLATPLLHALGGSIYEQGDGGFGGVGGTGNGYLLSGGGGGGRCYSGGGGGEKNPSKDNDNRQLIAPGVGGGGGAFGSANATQVAIYFNAVGGQGHVVVSVL